jgi:hypothetical protein
LFSWSPCQVGKLIGVLLTSAILSKSKRALADAGLLGWANPGRVQTTDVQSGQWMLNKGVDECISEMISLGDACHCLLQLLGHLSVFHSRSGQLQQALAFANIPQAAHNSLPYFKGYICSKIG